MSDDHTTHGFARWVRAPRTSDSTARNAYALEHTRRRRMDEHKVVGWICVVLLAIYLCALALGVMA